LKTRIKVCCIQSIKEAELALARGVDALGLVGPMPSGPGTLIDSDIREITDALPEMPTVLLSSETEVEAVCAHVARTRPKILQLVDRVDSAVIPALRQLYADVQIWQVIHVEGPDALKAASQAAPHVDALLLDSGAPSAAVPELGGTGRVHNWEISAQLVAQSTVPVWLAGGLNPDNVQAAIRAVRPHGVDICSGLRPRGELDFGLLTSFIEKVAAA